MFNYIEDSYLLARYKDREGIRFQFTGDNNVTYTFIPTRLEEASLGAYVCRFEGHGRVCFTDAPLEKIAHYHSLLTPTSSCGIIAATERHNMTQYDAWEQFQAATFVPNSLEAYYLRALVADDRPTRESAARILLWWNTPHKGTAAEIVSIYAPAKAWAILARREHN